MKYLLFVLSFIVLSSSCDTAKLSETPDSQFIGSWKLIDHGILENIEVEISKDSKGKLSGVVTKLNDNKYVQLFMEKGDVLISEIKRNSNYEFVISEKKIAAPLFSAYGQSTTSEFRANFDGKDNIVLGNNGLEGKYVKLN